MDFTVPALLCFLALAKKPILPIYSFPSLTVNARFAKETNPKINPSLIWTIMENPNTRNLFFSFLSKYFIPSSLPSLLRIVTTNIVELSEVHISYVSFKKLYSKDGIYLCHTIPDHLPQILSALEKP